MNTPKDLAIFDLDGTLISGQSQMLFVQYAQKKGLVPTTGYLKLSIGFLLYTLGIKKDPKSLMELGLSFFKNKPITELDTLIKLFFQDILVPQLNLSVIDMLKKHRAKGTDIILVSNAIYPIVKIVGEYLRIDHILCTQVHSNSDRFSGTIDGELMYGVNKLIAVKKFIEEGGEMYKKTWVYADHQSDIPLLEWSSDAVAVNPDGTLLKTARRKNWQIITT